MHFRCPECAMPGVLKIQRRINLPPDARSDEIILQIVACTNCHFKGIAVYEESRRGVLGDESWDHYGFRLPILEVKEIAALIRKCPNPRAAKCKCPAHRILGKTDASGRWIGLDKYQLGDRFPINSVI